MHRGRMIEAIRPIFLYRQFRRMGADAQTVDEFEREIS
jgi:hypothetical protein